VDHPVYAILNHHLKENLGNVYFGFEAILGNSTASDFYSGLGGVGMAHAMEERFENFDFEKEKISLRANSNPITKEILPNFPFRDDLKALSDSLHTFVQSYVNVFYETNSDVVNDLELQAWAAGVSDLYRGALKGFPNKFSSRQELATAVAEIISWASIMHSYMNGDSRWLAQTFPVIPKALYGNSAPTKMGINDARIYLAPTKELITLELVTGAAFFIPSYYEEFKMGEALRPNSDIDIFRYSGALGHSYDNELGSEPAVIFC
jgi:hypothetical protein